jgi:hypothetical protein
MGRANYLDGISACLPANHLQCKSALFSQCCQNSLSGRSPLFSQILPTARRIKQEIVTGETVEKVKMAILPICGSLKIKNLQTAKDYKMAISRVFRQPRKECFGLCYFSSGGFIALKLSDWGQLSFNSMIT